MNGNDRFLNVNDAHLRVTGGNVHASSFYLDQISITTTSTTSSTIDFLNETKAFNARSNIEVGTANLFVDTTTSNVGIHTSSPEYALDVHGPANVSVLTAASNVGILTTSPEFALDVHGTANVGVLTANTITGSGGTLLLGSHLIPTQHQQFDIGSAEYKIRHLYLSNNSLWIGDDSKISVVDGKMKFLKRDKNIVPSGTEALGGNATDALAHAKISNPDLTNINQMKLEHWLAYTKTLPGGEDKDIKDIFTTDTSNYESVTASEAFKEHDDTNIYSLNKLRLGSAAAAGATLDVVGTIKATSDLTVNTDTFHVDTTNNRVGILTTSPGHALDVHGTANVGVLSATSFVTNGTFKRLADMNGQTIKMTKYIATASNMKIATGLYTGNAFQWVSIRVKFTRLDVPTQTVQFDYLGTYGNSTVKNPIVIGDSPGSSQDNEVVVYNKTSTGEYEIYLQIDSSTTIDVEIYHKGSTIDEYFATLTTANSGAIDETGLTKIYDSGTHADFSLRDKNAIISDDAIYDNLYNYGDTQSLLIDRGVSGSVGTVTADTTYTPPPGVIGDVVCKFQNNASGEAVTNNFAPPGLTCSTGDKFTFGVWALATQNVGMEFFVNPAGAGSAVVGWQVIGDGNWRFYQNTVTTASGASNTAAFFRVDNNSAGSTVYLTGATVRKNPTSGVNLPYTPRYSPVSEKGPVLATRNLIAKEAAIKTLTGTTAFNDKSTNLTLTLGNKAGTGTAAGWVTLDPNDLSGNPPHGTGVAIWDALHVNGTFSATTSKGFLIDHPINPTTKKLFYAATEAPRMDLIYRGVVELTEGKATVNIDKDCVGDPECAMENGTFEALCRDPVYYLQNTSDFDRVIATIEGGTLKITSENPQSTSIINWMIVAERKDREAISSNITNDNGRLITEIVDTSIRVYKDGTPIYPVQTDETSNVETQ